MVSARFRLPPFRPARCARAAPLLLALGVGACRSNELAPSEWPPDDFGLEIRETLAQGPSGVRVRSFRVWRDGLALYAESTHELPGLAWSQPVFDTLCVYRLDPRSTRMLGRALQRAGLFEEAPRPAVNDGAPKADLVVDWTAFGARGRLGAMTHDRGQVERVLAAAAGFLPNGIGFLGVEADAVCVSDVPLPARSDRGAVAALRQVAREHPRDFGVLLDLYVAAVAAAEWSVAREALLELGNDDAREALGDEGELLDWRREALPKLRALLPDA